MILCFCSYVNIQTGELMVETYTSAEPAYVDQVKLLGNDKGTGAKSEVVITLRIRRNPVIGDKFASRHGQKGVCR